MKAILFIIGISLLRQDSYGQTTTIYGCKDSVVQVENTMVESDADCEDSGYAPDSFNITVLFQSADVGSVSVANVTCTANCTDERVVGTRMCGSDGIWSSVKWRNCSSESISTEQQLDDALTDTANTTELTPEVVNQAVDVLDDLSKQPAIEKEEADTALAIVNNILLGSKNEVGNIEKRILDAVGNIQNSVNLATGDTKDDYKQYMYEQSNLAIAVIGEITTTARAADYYYVPTVDSTNLVVAEFEIKTDTAPDDAMYIMVTPKSTGERISFQMFSDTSGIFSTAGVQRLLSGEVIFAASGNALGAFTMNFKISRDVKVAELQAMVFNTTSKPPHWEDAGEEVCNSYSVEDSYGKVTCKMPGQYILRQVDLDVTTNPQTKPPFTTPGLTGLSAGAIAGIVIGCVTVTVLIIGIIIYCRFK